MIDAAAPSARLGERGIGGAGAFSRLLDLPDDDCVQTGIMPLRARQVKVEQFDAPVRRSEISSDSSVADANARSFMPLPPLRRGAAP